jgi:hypothetical protein
VGNAVATTSGKNADTFTDGEGFTWVLLLHDGNGSTFIESYLNFDALSGGDGLSCIGATNTACEGTSDGGGGAPGATADLVAEETTSGGTDDRSSGGIAFDFHVADGSDGSHAHGLSLTSAIARVAVSGEGILGAGGEEERNGRDDQKTFHGAKEVRSGMFGVKGEDGGVWQFALHSPGEHRVTIAIELQEKAYGSVDGHEVPLA